MSIQSTSRNQSVPCREFQALIKAGEYGYLFEEYAAKIVYVDEYHAPMGGTSCQLIVEARNMQLLFDSNSRDGNPAGHPIFISESGLSLKEAGWLSPVQLSNFIEGRWSRYVPANEPPVGFESATARRHTFEALLDFFDSGEYTRRKPEFNAWSKEDNRQFMQQVSDRTKQNSSQ